MGVIPDPRLTLWAEMCAIGRAFVVWHSTRCTAPTSDEFKEMVAVYLHLCSSLLAVGCWHLLSESLTTPCDLWNKMLGGKSMR